MVLSGLIISSCLVVFALVWACAGRVGASSPLRRVIQTPVSLPTPVWLLLATAAFTLPVLEYWFSARSHGNALAGFLPWADATEYFNCAETFLLGMQSPAHCGKRPFYVAFFADLLWITGNRLQIALLLQAVVAGAGVVLFMREMARTLNGPAILGAYAVLFVYAAALCSGLVMTENIGLLLGAIAMTVLWRCPDAQRASLFLLGVGLMAAAVSVRPGPMFVLPALIVWFILFGEGTVQKRIALAALCVLIIVSAASLSAIPTLLAGGTLGATHSNFSYSFYGLAAGGKGWLQVTADHPELFGRGDGGQAVTNRIYRAAFESILNKPHLFVLGYIKGIAHYFDDLFRFATDFKPLRLAGLLVPWMLGVWFALKRWREPRYALLLLLQLGIIISSPFIAIDGHNRVFASTMGVDALFVALGMTWIGEWFAARKPAALQSVPGGARHDTILAAAGVTALIVPVALFAVIRPGAHPASPPAPECGPGLEAVVVQPGRSTLILPLVNAGGESVLPLRVRADHFGSRFHRWVHRKSELRFPPGTALLWAIPLNQGQKGKLMYFSWPGDVPKSGQVVGFCVRPSVPGKKFGTAMQMHPL